MVLKQCVFISTKLAFTGLRERCPKRKSTMRLRVQLGTPMALYFALLVSWRGRTFPQVPHRGCQLCSRDAQVSTQLVEWDQKRIDRLCKWLRRRDPFFFGLEGVVLCFRCCFWFRRVVCVGKETPMGAFCRMRRNTDAVSFVHRNAAPTIIGVTS